MLAQHRQPLTVGVGGRPDDVRRPPHQDRAGRDHGARRDQRALAQDAAIAEPGAGHEDRAVADLAQVADARPDDGGAVTENGPLPHPDRMLGRADYHPVLQDGRVVADAHRRAVRPHDQALRQDRAGPDVDLTQNHRRAGDLGLGLVHQHLVEAHGSLTVLLAVRRPAGLHRHYRRIPVTAAAGRPDLRIAVGVADAYTGRPWVCCNTSARWSPAAPPA
jgi:hypothetical protein